MGKQERTPQLVACSRRLSMAELPVKARVGIEMLAEAREGDFGAAHAVLLKLLGNIVAHPDELKYRRLRTTNAKIAALLQTRGVRALLIGLGFVEEGADSLVMPEAASASVVQTGLTALDALAVQRLEAENVTKQTEMQQRAEKAKEQNEKRKLMKMQIDDDAASRKEPGWKAKAAGIKGGRDIVGCSDVGASGSGG